MASAVLRTPTTTWSSAASVIIRSDCLRTHRPLAGGENAVSVWLNDVPPFLRPRMARYWGHEKRNRSLRHPDHSPAGHRRYASALCADCARGFLAEAAEDRRPRAFLGRPGGRLFLRRRSAYPIARAWNPAPGTRLVRAARVDHAGIPDRGGADGRRGDPRTHGGDGPQTHQGAPLCARPCGTRHSRARIR